MTNQIIFRISLIWKKKITSPTNFSLGTVTDILNRLKQRVLIKRVRDNEIEPHNAVQAPA